MITAIWWLPLAVCVAAWLWPTLNVELANETTIELGTNRTEDDLSDVVRQLFDGASTAFNSAIAEGRVGNALRPLNRMREIAPGSVITRAAELNYALHGTKLDSAFAAYQALRTLPPAALDAKAPEARALVLAYANRTRDFAEVIARLTDEQRTEANAHLLARAVLLSASPETRHAAREQALEILQSVPKPNSLAHEIAEMHLLADDWQAAQRALVDSAITPQSLPGQIYVARLGYLATGGNKTYEDQIQKFVTWNSDLELAQLAMGEMLLRQGNLQGARVRLAMVGKHDITLWAAERRVIDIDLALAAEQAAEPKRAN